jgi:predicted DNA-binding transcriptional regulator AlpA
VGRKVDVDDLVGAHEIAHRLSVARPQVIPKWRRRHWDFPKAVATLTTALTWDWVDVKAWVKS